MERKLKGRRVMWESVLQKKVWEGLSDCILNIVTKYYHPKKVELEPCLKLNVVSCFHIF